MWKTTKIPTVIFAPPSSKLFGKNPSTSSPSTPYATMTVNAYQNNITEYA